MTSYPENLNVVDSCCKELKDDRHVMLRASSPHTKDRSAPMNDLFQSDVLYLIYSTERTNRCIHLQFDGKQKRELKWREYHGTLSWS
jgi:hypothetical protein